MQNGQKFSREICVWSEPFMMIDQLGWGKVDLIRSLKTFAAIPDMLALVLTTRNGNCVAYKITINVSDTIENYQIMALNRSLSILPTAAHSTTSCCNNVTRKESRWTGIDDPRSD